MDWIIFSPRPLSPYQPKRKRFALTVEDYNNSRPPERAGSALFLGAVAAQAEHLVPVPLGDEAGLAAGLVLDALELGPAHLLDEPALHADEVVVVRAVELDLEARGAVAAHDGRDESALLEHLQRAEHGRAAHPVGAQ